MHALRPLRPPAANRRLFNYHRVPRNCTPDLLPENDELACLRIRGTWSVCMCEVVSCHGTAIECQGQCVVFLNRCNVGGIRRNDRYWGQPALPCLVCRCSSARVRSPRHWALIFGCAYLGVGPVIASMACMLSFFPCCAIHLASICPPVGARGCRKACLLAGAVPARLVRRVSRNQTPTSAPAPAQPPTASTRLTVRWSASRRRGFPTLFSAG